MLLDHEAGACNTNAGTRRMRVKFHAIEQQLQLMRRQLDRRALKSRPSVLAALQALVPDRQAIAVQDDCLEPIGALAAEQVQIARQRLGGSRRPAASLPPVEQLGLEGRSAPGGGSLPEGTGTAGAGGFPAGSGARPQTHVRATIAGGRRGVRGSPGHPGPQEWSDDDALQCGGARQLGGSREPDWELTRN